MCNDLENIARIPRPDQVLFEYGVCPKCGTQKDDLVESLHFHNTMIGVVGMRSGKSMCTAMICASYLHEVLCVTNLQEKYGLAGTQVLDGTFAAAAGKQASETVWGQFKGLYESSPWFQNYRTQMMDTEIADPSLRRGHLYRETDTSIYFREHRIRLSSVTSNSSTQAGRTRLFAVIDELSRFDSGSSKRSATEVYRALDNSLLTVRKGATRARKKGMLLPDGVLVCISSPIFSEDKSMQLLKDALKDPKMYSFHKATWEFNPTIEKEDLASVLERDPVAYERDFGAKPPGAENPFVRDQNIIDISIDKSRKSVFTLKEEFFDTTLKNGDKEIVYRFLKILVLQAKLSTMVGYHLHCDPGETGDSFCIAIGHGEKGKVIIDGAIEAKPLLKVAHKASQARSIHFPSMVDILLTLAKKYKITVSYDKWNSADQIHRLIDAGVPALGKNLTREDHINFLHAMQNGTISFPATEKENVEPEVDRNVPCATAIYQLRRLEDNGVKVDHPTGGHNDMIQCYVGVHRAIHNPDFVANKGDLTKKRIGTVLPPRIVRFRR